jgi:tetratricopeptide (TPR) repeat protein
MGAAASTLPAQIDKPTAQKIAGEKYDDAKFEELLAAQPEHVGVVQREVFLQAAGLDEDIVVASSEKRKYDAQVAEAAVAAVALSLSHEKRSSFLGAEVKEKDSTEEKFISAWQALNSGDVATAIGYTDDLLAADSKNEKAYYTRAIAYARMAKWRDALSDYSNYIKLLQQKSGAHLANALYGRALCLAKLGQRARALKDLDECIRVGPDDEQVHSADLCCPPPSHTPAALSHSRHLLHSRHLSHSRHLPRPRSGDGRGCEPRADGRDRALCAAARLPRIGQGTRRGDGRSGGRRDSRSLVVSIVGGQGRRRQRRVELRRRRVARACDGP